MSLSLDCDRKEDNVFFGTFSTISALKKAVLLWIQASEAYHLMLATLCPTLRKQHIPPVTLKGSSRFLPSFEFCSGLSLTTMDMHPCSFVRFSQHSLKSQNSPTMEKGPVLCITRSLTAKEHVLQALVKHTTLHMAIIYSADILE